MFIKVYSSYAFDHERFDPSASGELVWLPIRRIALVRGTRIGSAPLTVIESVSGRSFYVPGEPEALLRSLQDVVL